MQQINLYLDEFKPKQLYFSAAFTGTSVVVFIVFLCVMQWLMASSIESIEQDVIALENQKVATTQQVEKLKGTPLGGSATQLDEEIALLESEVSSREKLREIIEYQNLGNAEGFATVMAALSRQSIDIIALERIRVSAAGNMVELAGKTRLAKAVPVYIQALQTEPVLSNAKFGLLYMDWPKNTAQDVMAFSLGFESAAEATE